MSALAIDGDARRRARRAKSAAAAPRDTSEASVLRAPLERVGLCARHAQAL
jgi:hypothetical protein